MTTNPTTGLTARFQDTYTRLRAGKRVTRRDALYMMDEMASDPLLSPGERATMRAMRQKYLRRWHDVDAATYVAAVPK